MPPRHCFYCGHDNPPDAPRCAGCGQELSPTVPPDPKALRPQARSVVARVFSSRLNADLATQRLEEAGIRVVVAADDCGGMYPSLSVTGGIRLLVSETDLPWAKAILDRLEEDSGVKPGLAAGDTGVLADAPPLRRAQPHLALLASFILGGLLGGMIHYAVTLQRAYSGVETHDWNGDGKTDAWTTWEHGEVVQYELDRNFDGRVDSTILYKESWSSAMHDDDNFDGRTDLWVTYSNNVVTRTRFDNDFDGQTDGETRFQFGLPVETIFSISNRLGYWKRDFYTNGFLCQSDVDRDRDGTLDERVFFDLNGVVLKIQPLR